MTNNTNNTTPKTAPFNFVTFQNNVTIINTTPHIISIQNIDGTLITVPTSVILNASTEEEAVNDLFVKTNFVGTSQGRAMIADIKGTHASLHDGTRLVIVGSMIAARAYPGDVVALCPVPGYERVAPAEKRMRCDKFTVFA